MEILEPGRGGGVPHEVLDIIAAIMHMYNSHGLKQILNSVQYENNIARWNSSLIYIGVAYYLMCYYVMYAIL